MDAPEASEPALRRRLTGNAAADEVTDGSAAAAVEATIALIVQHVRGQPAALDTIVLDLASVPAFHREVYEAARKIPSGRTVSYGALATALGKPGAARAVGQAMGNNPWPIVVPCHRVLAANHATGGFSAHGGVETKARLLAAEGFTLSLQAELPFGLSPALSRRSR